MHGSPHFPSFLPIASGQMNAQLKIHSSLAESNTWPLHSAVFRSLDLTDNVVRHTHFDNHNICMVS